MSSLVHDHCIAGQVPVPPPIDHEARMLVRSLLAGIYPPSVLVERRREQRYPFPKLFVLTPVDAEGNRRLGPPTTAAGKHLSESGVSFFHPEPIAHRWVIASVPKCDGTWVGFLVDLDWCRFTRQGWYESGGRLLRAVTPASAAPATAEAAQATPRARRAGR